MEMNKANFVVWTSLVLVLSIPARWMVNLIAKPINYLARFNNADLPLLLSYLEVPGTVGLLYILYRWFDTKLWCHQRLNKLFEKIGLVNKPDLRGRWEGEIMSSHRGHKTSIPAIAEITQTFSDISILMYFADSNSTSLIAGFVKNKAGQHVLHYEYRNDTKPRAKDVMHKHDGVVRLKLLPDKKVLAGSYYTSAQDRGTYGTIELKFIGHTLLGRFEKD